MLKKMVNFFKKIFNCIKDNKVKENSTNNSIVKSQIKKVEKKQIVSKVSNIEKSYYDFMKEISSDELYERLIRFGLFSDKLPQFLETETFWDYCKNKQHNFEFKPYDSIKFESMRNNFIPRVLGIPVPMAHEMLSKCISDNWEEIKKRFKENTDKEEFKVSRIHIRKMKEKDKIFEMNYSNYKTDGTPEIEILIGKRFLVKTDISTCFPSMYTHALPWAIVGKETAKQKKNDRNEWFNRLDTLASNETNGETHGFIIGPHTSNILSEIILTKVDKILVEKNYKYVRHIDDYSCYVETEVEGKRFLEDLSKALREYDLLLNHKKTKIIKLPISTENEWIRKLNSFQFSENVVKFSTIRAYLDLAIDLTEVYKDAAILKYAIKVANKMKLTRNAKNYFIKTIFHYSLIYQYLIPILDSEIFDKYMINVKDIENIINNIYDFGIENNNYEAVMYGIYYALKNNVKLKNISVDDILVQENCLVPLLGYRYFMNDKRNKAKIKDYAKKLLSLNEMDRNWIFIYEVLSSKELPQEWKSLKNSKVTFIKQGF